MPTPSPAGFFVSSGKLAETKEPGPLFRGPHYQAKKQQRRLRELQEQ